MKKMAIIASYVDGQAYGLLGPQMAATVIQENVRIECIVIAVTRSDDKTILAQVLSNFFGKEMPIIGFSSHSIPLIIHHAAGLADWIRQIEVSEKICFERYVSVIGWWPEAILAGADPNRPA